MTESEFLAETMPWLWEAYPDGLWVRRNVGATKTETGRMIRFGMKGQADIQGILYGTAIELELKITGGRQSNFQKNWQCAVERAGGIYILAFCREDIRLQLEKIRNAQ